MSLTSRKPRPLKRDKSTYRDDRLFIVGTDDTYAPDLYFGGLRLSRVHVHVIPTVDGTSSAEHVLDRVLSFDSMEGDQRWLVLDTDHYASGSHLKSLKNAIRRAKQHGVRIAMSKPCFETWLLLHYVSASSIDDITDPRDALGRLKAVCPAYSKEALRSEDFEWPRIVAARARAASIDLAPSSVILPRNGSRVYKILDELYGSKLHVK